MARKKAGRPPMKAVAKVQAVTPGQLNLDFEGRGKPEGKSLRGKAPRVRKAAADIGIPEKPKG